MGGSDIAAIKVAAETLATKSQELGGALYAQQGADAAEDTGSSAPLPEDDGVVDAEVVEDERK